jgi:hypothetical protein
MTTKWCDSPLVPPTEGFAPTARQSEAEKLLCGPQRHTLLVGGARSGKTSLIVRTIAYRAICADGSRHAILRFRANAVRPSIAQDTLPKIFRLCFPNAPLKRHRTEGYFSLENESEIWLAGLDDADRVEKILGKEYATIFLNEWTPVAYTFSANANAYNGLEIILDFGNNFSSNAKSIQITECDIRVTPAATAGQANSNPPPPELRYVQAELSFCQRYFATNFANGATPANDAIIQAFVGFSTSTTTLQVAGIALPVQMRATPSLTFYSPSVGTPSNGFWSVEISGTWTATTVTSTAAALTSVNSIGVNVTTSGLTSFAPYEVAGSWTASAEL